MCFSRTPHPYERQLFEFCAFGVFTSGKLHVTHNQKYRIADREKSYSSQKPSLIYRIIMETEQKYPTHINMNIHAHTHMHTWTFTLLHAKLLVKTNHIGCNGSLNAMNYALIQSKFGMIVQTCMNQIRIMWNTFSIALNEKCRWPNGLPLDKGLLLSDALIFRIW